jgi:hypothetical protein
MEVLLEISGYSLLVVLFLGWHGGLLDALELLESDGGEEGVLALGFEVLVVFFY